MDHKMVRKPDNFWKGKAPFFRLFSISHNKDYTTIHSSTAKEPVMSSVLYVFVVALLILFTLGNFI
jgi:hypothetical protein